MSIKKRNLPQYITSLHTNFWQDLINFVLSSIPEKIQIPVL